MADISIWQKSGHFYFALTRRSELNVFDDFEKMAEVDVVSGKTTIGANDLPIDPLGLRTYEKCNQAGYVFWRAQAIQW